jgi:hypothetical protein
MQHMAYAALRRVKSCPESDKSLVLVTLTICEWESHRRFLRIVSGSWMF